ncbi:MAG TPA: histidine phosphatase family protein [Burkholderiaceae bacterium]|nr:histidine phosphatase family protein [Burkholderiaceae bacterium]
MHEPTRIVAIRHGETDWNVGTRIQGQLDVALNDTGRWQALQLARALAEERFAAIYSSDLARAWETALALSSATGIPVTAEVDLRERCFGVFQGLTFKDVEQRWPQEALRWRMRDPEYGPEGGERLGDFYERCTAVAARLAEKHEGQLIAIVAHGGVMDCLYRAAARIDLTGPRTWQLGNASINRLLHTQAGFTLVGWADNFHLQTDAVDEAL